MRLLKLEIQGFKSFAKKTEIEFDTGITAVIGPNGSGKSNIADAVRWVLGEQSAKALRGAKMEDVIFNGTQERKAQAFCEVLLTFDNADGTLPVDFNEVTVGRRVYRSGESEYAINRNPCRLKDVQEMFRDTGIGKEGYSIIGQGRVEEILSNRSNDRRNALEEAAGIMKYRARKEEASRKLENTRKNLDRLMDILNELELQREPLHEQAETAKEYLRLRDELKTLDINVFLHQYERTAERMKNIEKAMAEMGEEGANQIAREEAITRDCAAQEELLRQIEQSASALQNQLLAEMSAMDSHVGEVGVLRERRENLERDFARLQQALRESKERREEIQARLESLHNTESRDMLALVDEEIDKEENAFLALQRQIEAQEQEIERQKNSVIEQLNRLSDAKSQLSRMEAMAAALTQRLEAIEKEKATIEEEREGLERELNEARSEWDAKQVHRQTLLQEQETLRSQVEEAQEQSRLTGEKQRAVEEKLSGMRSRANVLEEMANAHEGYYDSVRKVMQDSNRSIELKRCVLGVVAELIQAPQQYETALEMSLGSALQNIVTPTPEDAKRVIEHLRQNKYGRATLLPVSAMRPRLLNDSERHCLNMPGCIGVAAELVEYDAKYRSVVENLLGRTVLVEDLQSGIALNKRANSSFRIATLQGDIINPGGAMTGGSVQKREFSLLGREREIKQLQQSILDSVAEMEKLKRIREEAIENEAERREWLAAAESRLHAHDIENARHKEKLDLIDRDIQANNQKSQRAQLEKTQLSDNLQDIEQERQEILGLRTGIEEGNAITQEDVQASQQKLLELRAAYEAANVAQTGRKVQRMALQKEEDALLSEQNRLQKELGQIEQSILRDIEICKENRTHMETLEGNIARISGSLTEEQALVDTHKEQHQQMEEERQQRATALSQSREMRDALILEMRDLESKKHRQEILLSRAEMEFASMQERIQDEYELTYEAALPLRVVEFAVTAAHIRIDELRAAIRELGNINVHAVEDYQTLHERYETLQTQCEDLNKAEEDLQQLITQITATMERQFEEQFRLIQKNFTAVFEKLFGGGWAELRLSDPNDALNCDIDIIAQPPGKKLQLLSLLSGGERALTAIALLFAILKLKPTVFCILDEIESSLDEVNVTRFANYLREYADDTQFILITHRKGSMEVCNALYGVAMEEKGISKVVSARLQDAINEAS